MPWWVWLAVGLLVALLAVLVWWYAARVDRVYRRISGRRLGLDRQLVRRSAEAMRIAESPVLGPADAATLKEAALAALLASEYPLSADQVGGFARQGEGNDAQTSERLEAESALTRAIREILTGPTRDRLAADALGAAQLRALDEASYRARIARNIHNQDVLQLQDLRRTVLVRVFHLAGRASQPDFVDIDDEA